MLSRRRTLTLLVVLCLGHVLLISSQVPSATGYSVLRSTAFGAMAGIQTGTAAVASGGQSIWSRYFALIGVARDNEQLRGKVLDLEGQLQAERARSARTTALEDALNLQRSLAAPTVAARVIAGNPAPGALTVTIDRGREDGVGADMAVTTGRGIVGRVIGQPSAHAAIVQLLVGRNAAAGAVLEKSGAGGIVSGGFADGLLRLELVSGLVHVDAGERIVTSGQDGIYPQGFLIGEVSRVEGAGANREIVVQPAVDFSHIPVVLVVIARPMASPGGRP